MNNCERAASAKSTPIPIITDYRRGPIVIPSAARNLLFSSFLFSLAVVTDHATKCTSRRIGSHPAPFFTIDFFVSCTPLPAGMSNAVSRPWPPDTSSFSVYQHFNQNQSSRGYCGTPILTETQ